MVEHDFQLLIIDEYLVSKIYFFIYLISFYQNASLLKISTLVYSANTEKNNYKEFE